MTDNDSILFGGNNQTNRTSWSTISIDTSSITASSIASGSIRSIQFYQPSFRYDYVYDYTNTYNKQTKKKTPSLKKKVLSNPLFTLRERNKLDGPSE